MSFEESVVERWSGKKIVAVSLAAGAAGVLPLLLYIAFGPSNGNPIGLGLLAVVSVPVAVIGVGVGLIKLLVEWFSRRE